MLRIIRQFLPALLFCFAIVSSVSAATLSPTLNSQLANLADTENVGLVIVAFDTNNGLTNSHLDVLRTVGIVNGITLQHLGMVAVPATAGQVRALASNSAVRSIWSNDRLHY